jgi:hypothetical protein
MARDTGEKGEKYMKNKIKYTDGPAGELRVGKDFLPGPEQLVLKEDIKDGYRASLISIVSAILLRSANAGADFSRRSPILFNSACSGPSH